MDKKHPIMLVIDGQKMKASVEGGNRPGTVRETSGNSKSVLGKKRQVLKDFSVVAGDNGGWVISLKYIGPKETVTLLCTDKKDMLETLGKILPENTYGNQG